MNTSLNFQINSSSQVISTSIQQSLITSVINILTYIYIYECAYLSPLEVILGTIFCILCLVVFIFNNEFYLKTSKNSRLYYILLAMADLIAVYTIPVMYFLGDGINWITNGNIILYDIFNFK